MTCRWHDTSLVEEGDNGHERKERISNSCIDVAYNIEDHLLRATSCNNREDKQEHVQDPQ